MIGKPQSLAALREEMELRFGALAVYASSWLQPVLLELLQRPLSHPRWRALSERFNAELLRRAEANGRSAEREMLIVARQALSLAVSELAIPGCLMGDDGQEAAAYALRQLRRRTNELVTRDLLGPGWRRPAVPPSEDLPGPSPLDALEATETAREFLDVLSAQEREAFHLVAQGIPPEEAAAAVAPSPGAARVLLHRFRGKARRILDLRKKPCRSKKTATT